MYVNSYAKETYTLLITLNLNIWGSETKSLKNIKVVNVALSDCSIHDHYMTICITNLLSVLKNTLFLNPHTKNS